MKNQSDNNISSAFEYVIGTLNTDERSKFEQQMRRNHNIADEVQYWETTLSGVEEPITELAPNPETLAAIQTRINSKRSAQPQIDAKSRLLDYLFSWKTATASLFAVVLVFSTLLFQNGGVDRNVSPSINADYVAVLLDDSNAPVLTALTAADDQSLFLKWEDWPAPQDYSLQLWSKSRRDGEVRPLLVFQGNAESKIQLDEATLRLIKDSSDLIITREELGGSPFDEPSSQIVARGVCIRLSNSPAQLKTT